MTIIPTHELVIRLLEDEYSKGYPSIDSFSKKVRLKRQTVSYLLKRGGTSLRTDNLDIILDSFEMTLCELESKYGKDAF